MEQKRSDNNKDLENLVGNTLRYGVWCSFGITLLGLVMILLKDADIRSHPEQLPAVPEKFSFEVLMQGIADADALQITMLGVLILLVTPLLRVIFALFGYLKEGNRLYFMITALVLMIIGLSAWIGAAH